MKQQRTIMQNVLANIILVGTSLTLILCFAWVIKLLVKAII